MYIKWLTYHVYKTSLQACWQNVWKYSPLKNVSVLFAVCHNRYYQQEITFKAIPNVILPVFFSHPYTAAVEEHSVAVTAVWCRKCAMILQKEKRKNKAKTQFPLSPLSRHLHTYTYPTPLIRPRTHKIPIRGIFTLLRRDALFYHSRPHAHANTHSPKLISTFFPLPPACSIIIT